MKEFKDIITDGETKELPSERRKNDELRLACHRRINLHTIKDTFELTNAPNNLQRMMNQVLHDRTESHVEIYLDDIIILSKTLEEHRRHLFKVFERLRSHN